MERHSRWRAAVAVSVTVSAAVGCGSAPGTVAAPVPATAPPASAAPSPATSRPPSAVPQLEPAAFARAVAEPRRVTINVHVPYEGQLDGTDLSIPYDRIGASGSGLPADRGTPLAVYCRTGRMSAEAVTQLTAMGYTDVVELAGGMVAWAAAGLPVRN